MVDFRQKACFEVGDVVFGQSHAAVNGVVIVGGSKQFRRCSEVEDRLYIIVFGILCACQIDPKQAAEEINLLHEGAIAVAHITGDSSAADTAKKAARILLESG